MNCCKICALLLSLVFITGTITAQTILESENTPTEKIFTEDTQNVASLKETNCDPVKCVSMTSVKRPKCCPPNCCKAAQNGTVTKDVDKIQNAVKTQNFASIPRACKSAKMKCCKKNEANTVQIAKAQ